MQTSRNFKNFLVELVLQKNQIFSYKVRPVRLLYYVDMAFIYYIFICHKRNRITLFETLLIMKIIVYY